MGHWASAEHEDSDGPHGIDTTGRTPRIGTRMADGTSSSATSRTHEEVVHPAPLVGAHRRRRADRRRHRRAGRAARSGNPSTKAATGGAGASRLTGQPAVGNGYLANEPGAVVFIQWTESGTDLTGSAQVETLSGSPPNQTVHTDTLTVSGQLQGSTITLSFNGGTEVFGTLSGGSFTVNFPQTDGSLAPVTFSSATAAQFNQALAELQGNTGSADSQAAAADQLAAERAAIDRASSEVSSQLSGLQSDVSSMNSSLGAFSAQLGQEQADLATEAALEQQVITESQNGTDNNQVCSDADTVASDGDTVDSDGDSVSSDADTTESDVTGVRNDIGNLQGAATALQNAQAALALLRRRSTHAVHGEPDHRLRPTGHLVGDRHGQHRHRSGQRLREPGLPGCPRRGQRRELRRPGPALHPANDRVSTTQPLRARWLSTPWCPRNRPLGWAGSLADPGLR